MNKLANQAIDAHGGLEHWNRFTTLSAHLIHGGELWAAKGKEGILADVTAAVDLRDEKASHWPFGSPDRRSRFEPQRVALEDANVRSLKNSFNPARRSKDTSLCGAICNSLTSPHTRCGPI